MQMDLTQKLSLILCCAFFSGHVCAAQETNRYNPNPASIGYVDAAIEAAFKNSIYTAGTAISIVNNVISGAYTAGSGVTINNGVISAIPNSYTGTGAISVNQSTNVISSVFTGANGITVDNNAATITGYTAGPGVSISGSTISGNYTGAGGITVNNSTGTISSTTVELGSCMYGGIVFYVDSTGQHGLVAQPQEPAQTPLVFNKNYVAVAAVSNGIGAGLLNTAAWMGINTAGLTDAQALVNTTSYAGTADGSLCSTPTDGTPTFTPADGVCYGQWYVPSVYEMELLFQNQAFLTSGPGCSGVQSQPLVPVNVGNTCVNLGDVCYWTSNAPPTNSNNVYVVNSAAGPAYSVDRSTVPFYYRAIRQF